MRVLSFDPGAKRMGWACLEGGEGQEPRYLGSGIEELIKGADEKDQEYRLRLIDRWAIRGFEMLERWRPNFVANETFPLFGGEGFSNNVQGKLAQTAITTLQTVCSIYGTPVTQVAAISVKARIGGTKKATKVAIRNGVIEFLPELAPRKKEWTTHEKMDETDAIGVGLVALGYRR